MDPPIKINFLNKNGGPLCGPPLFNKFSYVKSGIANKAFVFMVIRYTPIIMERHIRRTPSSMLSALITSTEKAAADAVKQAAVLTVALGALVCAVLNIIGVSFRFVRFTMGQF